MPDFTILFQKYVKESKKSDSTIARASGLSRAYINKIRNGKQFCKDYEKMMKAIECLQLDQNAEDELKTAYQMQLSDDNEYMVIDAIFQLIRSFSSIVTEQDNRVIVGQESYPDHKLYQNKENVAIICRKLIEQEAARQGGHLRLMIQPGCTQVQEAVKWGLRNHPEFQVEQLIGLEKTSGNNHLMKNNIDLFRQLVPIILSQQRANYKVYYHYECMGSYLSPYRMASNFLITSEQVLCLNDDFTEAILWSEHTCVAYFKKVFDKFIRRAELLYDTLNDRINVNMESFIDDEEFRSVYTMGSQPCFGITVNDEMIRKCAIDLNCNAVQRMLQFNQRIRKVYESKEKVVSYFTRKGIKSFLDTGYFNEIPKKLYRPLEMKERWKMIQSLITYAKEGKYEPHLINENKFQQYPMGLMIDCYTVDDIVMYFNGENAGKRFIMKETSLANCIYRYMEWIRKSSYIYTLEETLEYLEDVLADKE